MNAAKRPVSASSRYLVFTSAGDRANLPQWLQGRRNFDLWVVYYGEKIGRYADLADFYQTRKGSKWQNLKFAHMSLPELFAQYEAVMVLDDDVILSGEAISSLFEWRNRFDLWVLQPAFSPLGKISWPITRAQWQCQLRFTNFVENTCPLFRRDKLEEFMAVYDPVLAGFGVDWWFLEVLGPELAGKVAVIDEIVCINPHARAKGGKREIDQLASKRERQAVWKSVREKYRITSHERPFREFDRLLKPVPERWLSLAAHVPITVYVWTRHLAWRIRRRWHR